jgi:hypothetical protein
MAELLRPTDLEKIADDTEMAKARQAVERTKREKDDAKALREAFMSREVRPDAAERVNSVIRNAAQAGHKEVMVVSFAATYCNDGGRRINNSESDWPSSLEGFAKRAFEYHEKELRPLGYKIQARILDYPGGMPGTVGLFLLW